MEAYLLGTGGAIGAVLRHLVYQLLVDQDLPVPTLVVNVVGSFVFGLVVFGGAASDTFFFLGIGACGAFTTFSTFSYETVRLWQEGRWGLSIGNAAANALCSLGAMGVAWLLV
ncbi:fluoride efflux transporter FluC [Natronorarus salvus]|uniref:fluoride efflux transporter FluC n=1 Tax=Natronorarus salvus TaxID=3117733 RepID=UPI002F265E14